MFPDTLKMDSYKKIHTNISNLEIKSSEMLYELEKANRSNQTNLSGLCNDKALK